MLTTSAGRQVAVLLIGIVAGLVLVTSAVTARGTDLRVGTRTDVASLVRASAVRGDAVQVDVDQLRAEVDTLTAAIPPATRAALDAEATALATTTGAAEVTGAGVQVTLDDAPPTPIEQRPSGLGPDDLVVHQSDVQAVVNALWRGGAAGVQVMDQRLLTTSAVRCVGNTLILEGRVYSPPYVITAVGNPANLSGALAEEPGVALFRDYVTLAGLSYDEQALDSTTLTAAPVPELSWAGTAS